MEYIEPEQVRCNGSACGPAYVYMHIVCAYHFSVIKKYHYKRYQSDVFFFFFFIITHWARREKAAPVPRKLI